MHVYIHKKKLKTTIPVGFTKLYCGFEVRNEIIENSSFQMLQCVYYKHVLFARNTNENYFYTINTIFLMLFCFIQLDKFWLVVISHCVKRDNEIKFRIHYIYPLWLIILFNILIFIVKYIIYLQHPPQLLQW